MTWTCRPTLILSLQSKFLAPQRNRPLKDWECIKRFITCYLIHLTLFPFGVILIAGVLIARKFHKQMQIHTVSFEGISFIIWILPINHVIGCKFILLLLKSTLYACVHFEFFTIFNMWYTNASALNFINNSSLYMSESTCSYLKLSTYYVKLVFPLGGVSLI